MSGFDNDREVGQQQEKQWKWVEVDRDVSYVQASNCLACLHVGGTAIFFGVGAGGFGARLEVFTDTRWIRFRRRIRGVRA